MPEYLYHVNGKDGVIGRIERNDAHARKLLHRAGVVLVFDFRQRVCLARRSLKKAIFPGCIDSVCSFHVKHGQTYPEAAMEELFEETGFKAEPKYIGKFLLDEDPDRMIVAVFSLVTGERPSLDPAEAASCEFYNHDDAGRLMKNGKTTPWLLGAWNLYKKMQDQEGG